MKVSKLDLIVHKHNNNISGEISISGSKNSALAIIPAALLSADTVTLYNIPRITDIYTTIDILEDLGHFVEFKDNTLKIKRNDKAKIIFCDLVEKLRGSYYFISVYLSIFKKLYIKECGGCKLGTRPINFHLDAFAKLGVKSKEIDINGKLYNHYYCESITSNTIDLPYKSVGATINIILISVLSSATVTINNASIEPEVIDLCSFLNSMNASIKIMDNTITIKGVNALSGSSYEIISDRIEAGTYLALSSLPNVKSIKVKKANPLHLESYLNILSQIGLTITKNKDFIISSKEKTLKPVNLITTPYPGLPTDLAPIISIVLTQCKETSTLKDTVFPDRYSHVSEIQKLNANIQIFNNTLYIAKSNDPNKIKTNIMYAHDLRCAAALLLYAISVNEEIIIKDIDYLFRGYEEPIKKLQAIGITCSIIT